MNAQTFLTALQATVRWCNENGGFVSAVLTTTYVAATLALVLLARRQLQVAVELERSRSRPLVVVDLLVELPLVYLSIKNFGVTAARDVKIQVTPSIQSVYGSNPSGSHERAEPIPVLENGVPMLAPGREISGLVGQWAHVNSYNPSMRFSGEVRYKDADLIRPYSNPILIDLASELRLRKISRYTIHDLTKAVQNLHASIPSTANE